MRKHQSPVFPWNVGDHPEPLSVLLIRPQEGLVKLLPSEKYVHVHLPRMALTNESALSFLMPGVPSLPTVSSCNLANKTHRYLALKKNALIAQRMVGIHPLQVLLELRKSEMTARSGSFCSLGILWNLCQHVDGHTETVEGTDACLNTEVCAPSSLLAGVEHLGN